jgi:hypothetical protein
MLNQYYSDLAVAPSCPPKQHTILVPNNSPSGGSWSCVANNVDYSKSYNLTFFIATFWYFLGTLIFELPVLYIFGFRSKKSIVIAILANLLTVFSFHIATNYCGNTHKCNLTQGLNSGFILAEIIVTVVEALIYLVFLSKEIKPSKIIVSTILANLSSAILGGLIINNLLGGFH